MSPHLHMYPVLTTAIVPVCNLPALSSADPALTLTTRVLADIFRSNITRWNDPRIAATNPHLAITGKLPEADIQVVVRADESATTEAFKAALARFDPSGFGQQIPVSPSTEWPTATVNKCATSSSGTAPCVLATPFTIGYTSLAEAIAQGLHVSALRLQEDATTVVASVASVQAAFSASVFSKVGTDEANTTLKIDCAAPEQALAWPITTTTYLLMRDDTPRNFGDAACARRRLAVAFWLWFYKDPVVRELAEHNGLVVVPRDQASSLMQRLESDIQCEGALTYIRRRTASVLRGAGTALLSRHLRWHADIYDHAITVYRPAAVADALLRLRNGTLDFAIVHEDEVVGLDTETFLSAPYATTAIGFAFSFCGSTQRGEACLLSNRSLSLDMNSVAALLSGNMTHWLDKRLVDNNPWMALEPYSSVIGATRAIQLVGEARDSEASQAVQASLRRHVPSANMAALGDAGRAILAPNGAQVASLVAATPFSIGIIALGCIEMPSVPLASLVSPWFPNASVAPSRESVEACYTMAASAPINGAPDFPVATASESCYPLTIKASIVSLRHFYGVGCLRGGGVVEFLRWLAEAESMAYKMGWHDEVFNPAFAHELAALAWLSEIQCDGASWLASRIIKNLLAASMVSLVWAVMIISIVVVVVWEVWALFHWKTAMKGSQPVFHLIIGLGLLLAMAAGALSTADYGGHVANKAVPIGAPGRYPDLDVGCVRQVWYYFLGNSLVLGALVAKLWRVSMLFVNPEMRDVKVPLSMFLRFVGAIVLLNVSILVPWTAIAPPYYRLEIYSNLDEGLEEWRGSCELLPRGSLPYAITMVAIHLALIYAGLFLSHRSRNVNVRYTEGKSIDFILWQYVQMMMIAVTAGALAYPFSSHGSPIAFFWVKIAVPMSLYVTVMASLLLHHVVVYRMSKEERTALSIGSHTSDTIAPVCMPLYRLWERIAAHFPRLGRHPRRSMRILPRASAHEGGTPSVLAPEKASTVLSRQATLHALSTASSKESADAGAYSATHGSERPVMAMAMEQLNEANEEISELRERNNNLLSELCEVRAQLSQLMKE